MKYVNIQQEIVDALNAASESEAFTYKFRAQIEFDQRDAVFPRVIVRQLSNQARHIVSADADKRLDAIQTRRLGYQAEVYTRDTIANNGEAYDRVDVAITLSGEIGDWLWEKYGLSTSVYQPTVYDDATVRSIVRANGTIDSHGYIYNR